MNRAAVAALMRVQLISSCRSFPSVFYTIVLPIVLFVIFGAAFNVDGAYAVFFLPGMIGVMTSSDALFAVGPVMKEYYRQGIVREFKGYPLPLPWLFITFIATRLIFVLISATLLMTVSALFFGYMPGAAELVRYAIAVTLGFATYGFLALCISFMGIADNRDQGIISLYYFLGMFLSDAYLALSERWPVLGIVGYIFPLKPMLQFMRGDPWAFGPMLAWLAAAGTGFILLTRSMRLQRQ
jgi:ABC-2 type transport system permease protein